MSISLNESPVKALGVLQCGPLQQRDLINDSSELSHNYLQGEFLL